MRNSPTAMCSTRWKSKTAARSWLRRISSATRALGGKWRAALAGKGGRLRLRIAYHYTVPGAFGGRTQFLDTPNGTIYEIAQWYPRMAVYDDVRGWDPLPYLGAEFYLEYGNFDYA